VENSKRENVDLCIASESPSTLIKHHTAEKEDAKVDCMRNFLENDIKHLEREIADCNTRYSQLI